MTNDLGFCQSPGSEDEDVDYGDYDGGDNSAEVARDEVDETDSRTYPFSQASRDYLWDDECDRDCCCRCRCCCCYVDDGTLVLN